MFLAVTGALRMQTDSQFASALPPTQRNCVHHIYIHKINDIANRQKNCLARQLNSSSKAHIFHTHTLTAMAHLGQTDRQAECSSSSSSKLGKDKTIIKKKKKGKKHFIFIASAGAKACHSGWCFLQHWLLSSLPIGSEKGCIDCCSAATAAMASLPILQFATTAEIMTGWLEKQTNWDWNWLTRCLPLHPCLLWL